MNSDINRPEQREGERKLGLFDSIEIKGLSSKSARAFSSGKMARAARRVASLFAFTAARVYGFIFLSFGMLTLFLHLGEYYIMQDPVVRTSSLVIGAVFVLLSAFLLVSDKPICIFFRSSRLLDFIVFDFFLINRMQYGKEKKGFGVSIGMLIGFLLAVVGFFFPTEYAVLFMIAFVFVSLSFISPEFPYLFSLLIFPYLHLIPYSSYILAVCVGACILSYVRKVLVGKRIYSFEIYDALLILIIASIFISISVTMGGSIPLERAIILTVLMLGYVPASNMPVNRRLFDCVAGAMTASAVPVGVYSIVKYLLDYTSFTERTPSSAFFDSPDMLAVYLCAVSVFALYLSIKRVHKRKKMYYFSVFLISVAAIVTTECFAAVLAVGLSILVYALLKSRRISKVFILIPLLLPLIAFFLGGGISDMLAQVFSMSPSIAERADMLTDSVTLFFDNLLFGVGSAGGTEIYGAAPNIYVALACRVGIFALALFFITLVLRLLHLGFYRKRYSDSLVSFYVESSAIAAFAILVIGSYTDIFLSPEILYFFITVFATGSAALRVSKKEMVERLSYYKDLGTSDYAAIDVTLTQ